MAFRPDVEAWRSIFDAASGSVTTTDYILDWMDKESGGNACNLTTFAGFPEAGLLQLDLGNLAEAGTTGDRYRPVPPCTDGGGYATPDQFSSDQIADIVNGSLDFITAKKAIAHQVLGSVGASWDESSADFWALVRYEHAAGNGAAQSAMTAAAHALGRPPANFDEFSQHAISHWANVAAENGQWADGWKPPLLSAGWILPAVFIIAAALGAWLYNRRVGQRIGLAP
jgi:hypothetical protein